MMTDRSANKSKSLMVVQLRKQPAKMVPVVQLVHFF